jgi:hypothetical protein
MIGQAQAFFLGILVAFAPSILVLAWVLWRDPPMEE